MNSPTYRLSSHTNEHGHAIRTLTARLPRDTAPEMEVNHSYNQMFDPEYDDLTLCSNMEVLRAIRTANQRRALLESHIARMVGLARQDGASWQEIGKAIGLTKQGAQRRYASTPL